MKVAILNYGMGNLTSARMAFEHVGASVEVTSDHERVRAADAVVLPGVGAFPRAMKEVHRLGLDGLLRERHGSGVPIIGICLGMQLLFDSSKIPGEIVVPVSALDTGHDFLVSSAMAANFVAIRGVDSRKSKGV